MSALILKKYYTASLTEPQLGKNEPADVDSATSRNSLRQNITKDIRSRVKLSTIN
jgi:hypothetical protein